MKLYLAFILGLVFTLHCHAATTGRGKPTITTSTAQSDKNKPVQIAAFANAGKQPGVEIWRIENFSPVPWPKNNFGKFHTGDSYLILSTKNVGGKQVWDIYFWIGKESSVDESGGAAIMTVQLDNQLGGNPVQHREVQGEESQGFKSLFNNNISYLPGGVPSGLRHVDTSKAAEKKMFIVKGKKNARVRQIEPSVAAMNLGDCFILNTGKVVYVYYASKCNRVERLKAVNAGNLMRDNENSGKSSVQVIDESSSPTEVTGFFGMLGATLNSVSKIPNESVAGDDQAFEQHEEQIVSLFKVSDQSGTMKVEKLSQKPLKQEMLNTNDCFVLDTQHADVYVWIGKKCSAREKTEAMNKAQNVIKEKSYPAWARVQRIIELGEPSIFTQYFSTWKGAHETHTRLV